MAGIASSEIYSLQVNEDINVVFNTSASNTIVERARVAAAQTLLIKIVDAISMMGQINILKITGTTAPYTVVFQSMHGGSLADIPTLSSFLEHALPISVALTSLSMDDYFIILSGEEPSIPTLAALSLSAFSIIESATAGTIVGTINGKNPNSTLTLANSAGGRFLLSGNNIVVGTTALDFETSTQHSITVLETLDGASNSPRTNNFTINITNDPTDDLLLTALMLSNASLIESASAGAIVGSIIGKSSGSTLSLINTAGNRFALSGNNIVRGATSLDFETATSHQITIQETLGSAANSPRSTVLTINVINDVADDIVLNALSLNTNTIIESAVTGATVGTIVGKTSGSTLALTNNAGSRFVLSGTSIITGSTPLDYETATSHTIVVQETLAGASNNPRSSTITIVVSNDTSDDGAVGVPVATPDGNWGGVAGTGGAAPALDTSLKGSGHYFKPVVGVAEANHMYVGFDKLENLSEHIITVNATTGDDAGIKEVRIYNENSVPTVITQRTWNARTSSFGYNFIPASRSGMNGEALLTIDVIPHNGYICRKTLPLTLNTSTTARIDRPERFVDATNGIDSTTRGSEAEPWQSIEYAISRMTDTSAHMGGIIRLAAGTHVLQNNTLVKTSNKRLITIAPKVGLTRSQVTLKWLSRDHNSSGRGAGVWQPRVDLLELYNIEFETSDMVQIWMQNAAGRLLLRKCRIYDKTGSGGGIIDNTSAWLLGGQKCLEAPINGTGYFDVAQSWFNTNQAQRHYVMECEVNQYVFTGAHLARNVSGEVTFDSGYFGSVAGSGGSSDDTYYCNVDFRLNSPFMQKRHEHDFVTVKTATYDGTSRTVITFNETGRFLTNVNDQPMSAYKFLSGANVGRSSGVGGNDETVAYGGAHITTQFLINQASTISVASPAVVSSANHRVKPTAPIVFSTTGVLPTGIVAGQTYYVLSSGFTNNSFQISATLNGSPVVTTAAGSGTHSYKMDALIVDGDFSIATGGTQVGDKLRGYIIAHCDPLQFTGVVDNLMFQNYRAIGPAMGNCMLLQSSQAVTNLSGTVTISGTSFTTSASVALVPEQFIKITAGTYKGEHARVLTYDSAARTGTLSQPFSVSSITDASYGYVNAIRNVAFVNVIIGSDIQIAPPAFQWQAGATNLIIQQSTFIGPKEQMSLPYRGSAFVFRDNRAATPVGYACSDGLFIRDSIFDRIMAESVFPTLNTVVKNNAVRDTAGTTVGVGSTRIDVSFDANDIPTFGGTPVRVSQPVIPWSFNTPMGGEAVRLPNGYVGARSQ